MGYKTGHIEIVKYLIENKKYNNIDPYSNLLHIAVQNRHFNILKYLVENEYFREPTGINRAIEYASNIDEIKMVRYLVEIIEKIDQCNFVSLIRALNNAKRHNNLKIVNYLESKLKT